jgi:hypothetical protein
MQQGCRVHVMRPVTSMTSLGLAASATLAATATRSVLLTAIVLATAAAVDSECPYCTAVCTLLRSWC